MKKQILLCWIVFLAAALCFARPAIAGPDEGSPGAFAIIGPENGAMAFLNPGIWLSWNISNRADRYEYCLALSGEFCDQWYDAGTATRVLVNHQVQLHGYYRWQVRAVNSYGITYGDNLYPGHTYIFSVASSPTGFEKMLPADGAIEQWVDELRIEWSYRSDGLLYFLCIDTIDDDGCNTSWYPIDGRILLNPPYTLQPNTTYFWQVRAHGKNAPKETYADGAPEAWWKFTTAALPGSFRKTTPGDDAVGFLAVYPDIEYPTLKWGASSGTVRYEHCIDQTDNNLCDTSWVNDYEDLLSITLGYMDHGKTYYWQVRSRGPGGYTEADNGKWFKMTTVGEGETTFRKTKPTHGDVSLASPVTLAWTPAESPNATYEVCVDPVYDFICTDQWVQVGKNLTTTTSANLDYWTTYYWQVRAIVPGQPPTYSDLEAWGAFTTEFPPPPPAFNLITPANGTQNVFPIVTLRWEPGQLVDDYTICINLGTSNLHNCENQIDLPKDQTSVTVRLPPGKTYYWLVIARNIGGSTAAPPEGQRWSFTTLAPGQGVTEVFLPVVRR